MNIAKALKEKNRITGRIKKLQANLLKYNRHQVDVEQDFDPNEIYVSLQEEWAHLINLKGKIAAANAGIADKLIQLTEAKAELQFWTGFSMYAGPNAEIIQQRKLINGQYEEVGVAFTSYISSKEAQGHVDRVQKAIEDLQDEIDTYNGITNV